MFKLDKRKILFIAFSVIIASFLLFYRDFFPQRESANDWFYDRLVKAGYFFRKLPRSIGDISLVLIDNRTLGMMPSKWPYPRSDFAKVIENLENAGSEAIGFDFVFLGSSSSGDDDSLKRTLKKYDNIVLPYSVNAQGSIDIHPVPMEMDLGPRSNLGVITKLQDEDGFTRKAVTYLVNASDPKQGFLSWELEMLKVAKSLDLASFSEQTDRIALKDTFGKTWEIPVSPDKKSFLINFRAHTLDFKTLSFYDVLNGNFDASIVNGKVVLIGLASSVFADIHNTPIGWLPGITLNANAFLTIYGCDFIREIPLALDVAVILFGVALAAAIAASVGARKASLYIAAEIFLFFIASYILYINGYLWSYVDFPVLVILCFITAKKILRLDS